MNTLCRVLAMFDPRRRDKRARPADPAADAHGPVSDYAYPPAPDGGIIAADAYWRHVAEMMHAANHRTRERRAA